MFASSPRPLALIALTLCASAITGCSFDDPYNNHHAAPAATAATPSAAAAPQQTARTDASTAPAAIRAFTTNYINWRFAEVAKIKTALIARADGLLAEQLRDQAAQATTEASRRVSNAANQGSVEVVNDPKGDGRYLVVTHETAVLGDAHSQPGYFVYRATVHRVGNAYKLTSFEALS